MEHATRNNLLKIIFNCIIFILLVFNSGNYAAASDYKYKVLDPKYNPEAQQLIDGTLPPERTRYIPPKKNFDIGTFLAIFALVTFPFAIVYIAVKTFKDVMSDCNEEEQVIGNIKIEEKDTEELDAELEKYHIPSASKRLYQQDNNSENPVDKTTPSTQHRINTKEIPNNFVQKYFSSPVEKSQNPILLYTSPLASNKGFCLVEYNRKYSLIGYINDDIFLLNQFDNVKTKEIRARLSETQKSKERYIIKLDNYQALVEVSDKKMNLLVNL